MISEVFPTANPLKISDISKLFNIPISALRYYEKEGLCHFKRSGNNYRFADIRTIRNLCDISFYRKLSCSIEQLHQLNRMDHRQIYQLLAQSRQKLQRQLQELHQMLEKTFGTLYEEEYGITGDTTIAEYVGFINSQPISGVEKEILLQPVT